MPASNMDPKGRKYETIWNAEDPDQEEFLSDTDVEASHHENEKQWHCEGGHADKWSRPRGVLVTIKTHRWMIDTFLLLVITGLLVLLLFRPAQLATRQVGGDFTASSHEREHFQAGFIMLLVVAQRH